MRTLRVGEQVWQWSVGRAGAAVVLIPPEGHGRKLVLTSEDVTGLTPEEVARGQWKQNSNGSITPSHIRAFIDSLTPCIHCGKKREVVSEGTPCFGRYGSFKHQWQRRAQKEKAHGR